MEDLTPDFGQHPPAVPGPHRQETVSGAESRDQQQVERFEKEVGCRDRRSCGDRNARDRGSRIPHAVLIRHRGDGDFVTANLDNPVQLNSDRVWHSDCSSKTYGPGGPNGAVFIEGGDDPGQVTNASATVEAKVVVTFVAPSTVFRIDDHDAPSCP